MKPQTRTPPRAGQGGEAPRGESTRTVPRPGVGTHDPEVLALLAPRVEQDSATPDAPQPTRTRAATARLVRVEPAPPPPASLEDPDGRITIRVDVDEARVATEVLVALATRSDIFHRAGALVHVVRDGRKLAGVTRPAGAPRISPLSEASVRERAAESARFYRWRLDSRTGEWSPQDLHPPDWSVRALMARGEWPNLRPLEGVVECPVLRPDGTVLQESGYDSATGLLYLPSQEFPTIGATPRLSDARAAARELLDLVADFPFAGDAHRTAWLAAAITPLARYAFAGPAPLNLFDKNVPGAGGSMLADIVGEIVSGRPMPRMSQAPNDEEERKRITALALSGVDLVLIDNVAGAFGTPSLDAALTGEEWRDRGLGGLSLHCLPLAITFYATGNNVQLAGDIVRRCLHCRLESPEERPEERADFRYPDLRGHVRANRGRYVAALLTVLRAYTAAGRPAMNLAPWGSFEGWSKLVRAALVWCGLPDPGETRRALKAEADVAAAALGDLIDGWADVAKQFGGQCTVAQALKALADNNAASAGVNASHPVRFVQLRAALAELCPTPPGTLPTAKAVGNVLRRYRDRVVEGRALTVPKADSKTANVWAVRSVEGGSVGVSGGHSIPNGKTTSTTTLPRKGAGDPPSPPDTPPPSAASANPWGDR